MPHDTIVGIVDTLTTEQRSERMSRVRSKDSKAELAVRRLVFSMGYRYRLHRRDLPGSPDLAFPSKAEGYLRARMLLAQARGMWPDAEVGARVLGARAGGQPRANDEKNLRALDDMGWRAPVTLGARAQRSRRSARPRPRLPSVP